jgi:hypothetical protein
LIPARSKGRVVVTGILFWYPLSGVTYQFLHYLIGLERLGYEVYYAEDPSQWIYDPVLHDLTPDAGRNVGTIAPILEEYGFKGRWAFRGNYPGGQTYGMTKSDLNQLYRDADVILNITGQEIREEHRACPLLVYVETDPVGTQIRVFNGDQAEIGKLKVHDVHFSFGENLGAPDCKVPTVGFDWRPTRQPVVLDLWNPSESRAATAFTTIATWRNPAWKDLVYLGEKYYWSKEPEFLKIIELPRRNSTTFELAMRVDDHTEKLMEENGWKLRNAYDVTKDMNSYRTYISNSRGEFTVAKDQNIRLRSGWFSDRSACYLAAGRPVVTQETGFSNILPTGLGLYGWETLQDIVDIIDRIEADYEANRRAAREIAEEFFNAEKVLGSLMSRVGL